MDVQPVPVTVANASSSKEKAMSRTKGVASGMLAAISPSLSRRISVSVASATCRPSAETANRLPVPALYNSLPADVNTRSPCLPLSTQ